MFSLFVPTVDFDFRLLHAGPLIVISTILIIIFSNGLSDNGRNDNSAYSVFNRGYQRILGSIDVESLVAQHIGGGGMILAQQQQQQQQEQEQENEWNIQEDDNIEGNGEVPNEPLQRRTHRRSGKKARRRNLEERRDRQRQRERARELGFENQDMIHH